MERETFLPSPELVVGLQERVYTNLLETGGLPVTMKPEKITVNSRIYTLAVTQTLIELKKMGLDIAGEYKKKRER